MVSSLRPNQTPPPLPKHSALPVGYSGSGGGSGGGNIPVVSPIRQPPLQHHEVRVAAAAPVIEAAVTRPPPRHVFGSFEEVDLQGRRQGHRQGHRGHPESEQSSREVDYADNWDPLQSSEVVTLNNHASQEVSHVSRELSSQEEFPWQEEYDYEYEYEEEDEEEDYDDNASSPQSFEAPISVKHSHLHPDTLFGFTVPTQQQACFVKRWGWTDLYFRCRIWKDGYSTLLCFV